MLFYGGFYGLWQSAFMHYFSTAGCSGQGMRVNYDCYTAHLVRLGAGCDCGNYYVQ